MTGADLAGGFSVGRAQDILVDVDGVSGSATYAYTGTISHDEVPMAVDELGGAGGANIATCRKCPECDVASEKRICKGSVQSQLLRLPNIDRISVSRSGPFVDNGYEWSITFYEDGDIPEMTVHSNNLYGSGSQFVTVTTIGDGAVFDECTGYKIIPSTQNLLAHRLKNYYPATQISSQNENTAVLGLLEQGRFYYGRVFAYNEIGFSHAEYTTPKYQKPMIVPKIPLGVILEVFSGTQLRVYISPPADMGGDEVSKYTIEWDTNSSFSSGNNGGALGSYAISDLSGGAPYVHTMSSLSTGVVYWVRVNAYNQMGYSFWTPSSPPKDHPRQKPLAPTDLLMGVTSSSMLTVAFDQPTNNGGDPVTSYKLEWDRQANFLSLYSYPQKGELEIDATQSYYTLFPPNGLTDNVMYYLRLSAKNQEGYGIAEFPSPQFAAPVNSVPGKVTHFNAFKVNDEPKNYTLSWNPPFIPAHGIPCSGNFTHPGPCPFGSMGVGSQADGGTAITSYIIEASTRANFNTDVRTYVYAGFQNTVNTTQYHYKVTNLTVVVHPDDVPGSEPMHWYFRVSAANVIGAGDPCAYSGFKCAGDRIITSATGSAIVSNLQDWSR
jgi:hypothetical protein